MLINTGINLHLKVNQKSVTTSPNFSVKLNSQIKTDTISFGSLPYNFGEVTKNLFRGARPEPEDLAAFKKRGIKSVLDLTNLVWEKADVEKQGMAYVSSKFYKEEYKCKDSADYCNMLKSTAEEIKELLENGSAFVHCKLGESRTGEVIAAFQYYILKMPEKEILEHASKYGSKSKAENVLEQVKKYAPRSEK